jgi:acyl-CoA thioesterase FadM
LQVGRTCAFCQFPVTQGIIVSSGPFLGEDIAYALRPMTRRILLDDCDAAGVVFGPHIAALAHQAYEEALAALGIDFAALIRGGELALPYVHLECEFRAPMRHGDLVDWRVSCSRIGGSSFTMRIEAVVGATSCAVVNQTHVAIDPRLRSKVTLPTELRAALTTLVACTT